MTTKIMPERLAESIERRPQTARIGEFDAWGKLHRFQVTWMPEIVRDVALGHENVGQVPVLWDGQCPCYAKRSQVNGGVFIVADPVRVDFERSAVFEPCQVDTIGELEPGTFHLEEG